MIETCFAELNSDRFLTWGCHSCMNYNLTCTRSEVHKHIVIAKGHFLLKTVKECLHPIRENFTIHRCLMPCHKAPDPRFLFHSIVQCNLFCFAAVIPVKPVINLSDKLFHPDEAIVAHRALFMSFGDPCANPFHPRFHETATVKHWASRPRCEPKECWGAFQLGPEVFCKRLLNRLVHSGK